MTTPAMRIGHGIDAHRYVPGRPLMLGGVRIPYDQGLLGHSDGDAVAHALADAILGAAGMGDMGGHFPSTDPRWKDTAGVDFLAAVAEKISSAGWAVLSAHALADAILGAAGMGDMGGHFPSTDPRWKDTAGVDFLAAVAEKISSAGWAVLSAHVVAITEEPRLAPHLAAMAQAMSRALGVPDGTVEVGATTTDGMGFAGRGEGVAASAMVLLTASLAR